MDILFSLKRTRSAGCHVRKLRDQGLWCSTKRGSCSEPLLMSLGRSLVPEQWQESQCKFCRCRPEWMEFKKVLELDDMGIAIYRYMATDEQDDGSSREIFLIRNSRGVAELTSSMAFTKTFAKCKTACPKCKEMLERAERLLMSVPWVIRRGVAAVCDHLFQNERVYCPPCNAIADKFLSFINNEVRLRRNPSPAQTKYHPEITKRNPKGLIVEDAMKSALYIQASEKEEIQTQKKEKSERQMRKRAATDYDDKTEASKVKMEKVELDRKEGKKAGSKSNKKRISLEQKEEDRKEKNEEYKENTNKIAKKDKTVQSSTQEQKVTGKKQVSLSTIKIGKQDKILSKKTSVNEKNKSATKMKPGEQALESLKTYEKVTSKSQQSKSGNLVDKDLKLSEPSVTITENKTTQHEIAQMNLMRMLIAEQLKHSQNQDKLKKDRDKERDDVEKKAAEAEKRVMEAERIAKEKEETRRLKLNAMNRSVTSLPSSVGHKTSVIEECDNGAIEEIHLMVKGEKLCISKDVKAPQLSPSLRPISPKPCPPSLPQHKMPQAATRTTSTTQQDNPKPTSKKAPKVEVEKITKGVMRYSLSDRKYIEKGWTELPKEMLVRQMTKYRMHRAHPEFDWFEHNKHKERILYGSGELLAKFDEGRCRLYYKSGKLALNYYEAEEVHAGQRIIVYSTGERDALVHAHPRTVLAMFDYDGNGIVFDHVGNVRLKYNQTEGVILDRDIGPESHWKWHNLNDPPLLRTIITETHLARKDPTILKLGASASQKMIPKEANGADNSEMIAIEMQNIARQYAKHIDRELKYIPYKIRMKALKINEQFTLKVLDQATVYLNFCDGSTNLKINIGMMLDPSEIVCQEFAEVGEVLNVMDKLPDSDSVEQLKEAVWKARAAERARVLREQRLNPPTLRISIDQWKANISRPLKPTVSQYCSPVNN